MKHGITRIEPLDALQPPPRLHTEVRLQCKGELATTWWGKLQHCCSLGASVSCCNPGGTLTFKPDQSGSVTTCSRANHGKARVQLGPSRLLAGMPSPQSWGTVDGLAGQNPALWTICDSKLAVGVVQSGACLAPTARAAVAKGQVRARGGTNHSLLEGASWHQH